MDRELYGGWRGDVLVATRCTSLLDAAMEVGWLSAADEP